MGCRAGRRMAQAVTALAAACGALAGCHGAAPPGRDDTRVVNPPSAPPATTRTTTPTTTSPPKPASSRTTTTTTTTTTAAATVTSPVPPTRTSAASPAPTVNTPLARYDAAVARWQAARSTFIRAATSGVSDVAAERRWASTFLAAERSFARTMTPPAWPAASRAVIGGLLHASATEQRHLLAMSRAPSPGAFTGELGGYSVDTAAENTAVGAVRKTLGG